MRGKKDEEREETGRHRLHLKCKQNTDQVFIWKFKADNRCLAAVKRNSVRIRTEADALKSVFEKPKKKGTNSDPKGRREGDPFSNFPVCLEN